MSIEPTPFAEHPAPASAAGSCPNGEAAAEREARRMARLARLEGMREMGYEMACRLNDWVAGRLPEPECAAFADIKDPVLAFSRMTSTVRRIIALEERLDEDAETREARIAAEAAERARKIAAEKAAQEEAELEAQAGTASEPWLSRTEKEVKVRLAVRDIHRAAEPDMDYRKREDLLDDLFLDYDETDYGYDRPLDDIVADLCEALGLETVEDLAEGVPVIEPELAAAGAAGSQGPPGG
jgi:hypothetical protein